MPLAPLTDEELERLDDFLMSPRTPDETMDVETLDGFLVALTIGPEPVPEEEWLPQVFSGTPPEFADQQEADEVMDLLRRHAATVADAFSVKQRSNVGDDPLYFPLILSDEGADEKWQESLGAYWAGGFRLGMLAHEAAWQAALDEDDAFYDTIAAILTLEEGHHPEDESDVLSVPQREERVSELPWLVEDVMFYWLEARYGKVETVVRDGDKVGRNDPCPCGSGKKYKKCHGA
ncbi:hypothetical protein GCM10007860_04800 [Chitiniphilus shinanonensis]|uniref:YecA family protein n=1 Tax=Chitiniphilus shinanonensis TaxID=553088 RepID=A0ABQ6BSZ5_9NEIS|nr:UPF0149 family protein [Chitiniphilus shinanonensis]GLS03337.1 hypothetical protein GCM10007860_04800 [Chitiniphilus shinanonensis]